MSKRLILALSVVTLALTAAVAAAYAAKPKDGNFAWAAKNGNESLSFAVKKSKFQGVVASSVGCNGGAPVTITKKFKAKASGRFRYRGKGYILGGEETKVTFKGRFVSRKKAKGLLQVKGCKGLNFTFTAEWAAGG